MNIVLCGIPRSGKTSIANKISEHLKIPVMHTDDLKDLEWSAASEKASWWFDAPGDWIIEGVMAVRALRKWLERNPGKRLGDHADEPRIMFLGCPLVPLTKGQAALGKGCWTVFEGIQKEICKRGMSVASVGQNAEFFFRQLGLLPMLEGEQEANWQLLDVIERDEQ